MKLTVLEFFFINGIGIVLLKALSLSFFSVDFGSANRALIHICLIQILRSLFPISGHIVFIRVGCLILVWSSILRFLRPHWWKVYIDFSLLFIFFKIAWIATILGVVLVSLLNLRTFVILKVLLICTYVTFSFDRFSPFVCLSWSSLNLILVVFVSHFRLSNWIFVFLFSVIISVLMFLFSISLTSVMLSPTSTVAITIVFIILLLLLIVATSSDIFISTLSRWWIVFIIVVLSLILLSLNVLMIVYIITIWFHTKEFYR